MQQKQHEQQDHHQRTQKAQLLAHDAEDKIVGALRQPELFFNAVAQPQPGQPAGTNGIQALQGLVGHLAQVLGPAVQTALQVGDGVDVLQDRFQQHHGRERPRPGQPAAVAAQQQDGTHDRTGQHDAGHMRLHYQQ